MPKLKVFLASALLFTLVTAACSGARSTEPTTTFGTVVGPARTLPTLPPNATTPGQTTPLTPVLSSVDTSTTTTTTSPSTASTSSSASSSTTKDWEVVGGIFTTKSAAQSQIDKLTAAKFTGFSLKAVGAKTAAVLPGLTKADATAMAAKINTAGVATATTFHLTTTTSSSSSSSTTKDWEVVGGIFTTKAAAQSQIDKLTAAKFTGFSLKAVGAKTAAVLPGLTKADATALAAKINKAGVATATTFQLTSSSTSATTTTTIADAGATNWEVVDGIFTTKTGAQAKIDKLTAAKFTKFTIKPIPGEFAVVKAGLTKAEATDLMTKINAANLGPARIKAL